MLLKPLQGLRIHSVGSIEYDYNVLVYNVAGLEKTIKLNP